MATGLATAAVREGKGTGKQVRRDEEAAEDFELALPETSGLCPFGCDLHTACNSTCRTRKSRPFFRNAKIEGVQESRSEYALTCAVIRPGLGGLFGVSEAAGDYSGVPSGSLANRKLSRNGVLVLDADFGGFRSCTSTGGAFLVNLAASV
jgi:hypothetical protein